MITIRKAQFEVLREYSRAEFEKRMVAHLRGRFPNETGAMSADQLWSRVRSGVERAKAYGLETEAHLRSYLELSMIHGPDFDANPKTPWAGRILTNARLSADEKVRMLEEQDTFSRRPA